MFIYKNWKTTNDRDERILCRGWFLFGFIPLVIWKVNLDLPRMS